MMDKLDKALDEIEKRRAERRAQAGDKRTEQLVIDMTALDELEAEHGLGELARINMPSYKTGLPTMVIVKAARGAVYRRYRDMACKAEDKKDTSLTVKAAELTADTCLVYPPVDTFAAMCEQWPGCKAECGSAAILLAQVEMEREKKG